MELRGNVGDLKCSVEWISVAAAPHPAALPALPGRGVPGGAAAGGGGGGVHAGAEAGAAGGHEGAPLLRPPRRPTQRHRALLG